MNDAPSPESRSRYQVITTLGQGGMARVLLTMARGPADVTKLLVVKELKEELKTDPEFVTMFLDEARIAARLNHPNVIQTYEVGNDGDHPIIVMEYLEGQSLSAVLGRVGRKVFPLDLHLFVLAQVAAALHYAHELKSFDGSELGLVHRDVSPHNVFVTYDGLVKLVDFGIAKAADSAGLTRAGVFKGKTGYAAPEQLAGTSLDRRADVFALGVMLWEALAQRRLTYGEAEAAVMHRRLNGADPKIDDVAPSAPEELRRICDKAMAHDPANRYATAAELRAAIEGYLRGTTAAGGEEVGALVRQTFAADREKVRSLVEAQIKAIRAQGMSGEHPAPSLRTPSLRDVPTEIARRDTSEPRDSTMKVTAASAPTLPSPTSEASGGKKLVIAGVVAAAIVAAITIARSSRTDAPATAAAPAAAATVDVWITAQPREARIFLDDTPLADNPFHGAMPRSAMTRKLRVSAPGFTTDERLLTLDRDMRLDLALQPVASAAPTATAAPQATAPASPSTAAPRAAAAPPAAAPPPTAAPAPAKPAAPTPGEALTGPQQKKTRQIDETF